MNETPILRQIADQYDLNVKTITRRIKEHPELGIEIQQRKAPVLSYAQIQGLCKILDDEYGHTPPPIDTLRRVRGMSQEIHGNDSEGLALSNESLRIKELEEEVSRLKEEVSRLERDLAKLEGIAEEREKRIADIKEVYPKRLKAGEEEIKNLKVELSQARDEWKSKSLFDRWFRR